MGVFYKDWTWVPVIDAQGHSPAEVYWTGAERGAYVAWHKSFTYAYVFGEPQIDKVCWTFPEKTVSHFQRFSDFNDAKRWSETMYKLTGK